MSLVGAALEVFLCLLLVIRKTYRQFRVFSLYVAVSIIGTITLITLLDQPSVYLEVYWPSEAVSVVVTFLALQESVYLVFRNFRSMTWFKLLFPSIGFLMLFVAILRALLHPVSQAGLLASTLISLEIGVGFLQFGIFALFILLVRFFHMRWRQQAFGVVLGFGTAAAGSLVPFLLRSEFGTKFNPIVRIAPAIAYILAVVVWLATFLRPEPALARGSVQALTPEQMVSDLRRYTHAVKGILER